MAPTEQQRKTSRARELAGGKVAKARVQRYLKSTQAQLKEDGKSTLLFKGIRCNNAMAQVLQELRAIQAPAAKLLSKTNQITAFDADGQQSVEFLATKNDCALFALASHNKKRPNNLVMGRTFDRQVLDMVELGIDRFKSSLKDFGGSVPKKRIGSKPLMLFVGDLWQAELDYKNLQNLLTDFYRGQVVDKLVATGVDHLMVFTICRADNTTRIHQRTYFCKLKKNPNNSKAPFPYLESCGPDLDFRLRRSQWADTDLYKASRRQPESARKKKSKNQSTNLFGETIGRLHLERQNLDQRGGRKSKALRRAEKAAAEEEDMALESELGKEKEEMGQEFQNTFGFQEED